MMPIFSNARKIVSLLFNFMKIQRLI